jgi:hypothetical protein
MDTRDLTDALRDATDGLEPRAGFAADVLRGGRRRRTRGRIVIGAAIATAAAVAVAVAVAPTQVADQRPADTTDDQPGYPLWTSGGDLIDDAQLVQLATTTWRESIPHTLANKDSLLSQPLGEPHVTWAGSTPRGPAVIVAQQFTMPKTDSVESSYRGQQALAVGLLAANPADTAKRELELIGVQIAHHWARPGSFVFPDNRTVISVAFGTPPDSRVENISPNLTIGEDGVSRREWSKPLRYVDGVWIGELPAGVSPLNVRMIDSQPDLDPNDAEERPMGLHNPLLFTSQYISGELAAVPDRGLPWAPQEFTLGVASPLSGHGWDRFQQAVRDSGLLEPTSYTDIGRHWTAVVGLQDGRTVLISTYQELDNPAYVFQVLVKADGTVEKVTRGGKLSPSSSPGLMVRLPGDNGWVVGVDMDMEFRYRMDGSTQWSGPEVGVALIPAGAVAVQTQGHEYPLY